MILMLILPAWILALAVVGGLCVAAGRGDSALLLQHSDAQSSELVARGLHVIGSAARTTGADTPPPRATRRNARAATSTVSGWLRAEPHRAREGRERGVGPPVKWTDGPSAGLCKAMQQGPGVKAVSGPLTTPPRTEAEPTDGRRARGMRSRRAILERSVQMGSREGLEGITIGALAADLGVHKSNVFALFGSKLELQLATLGAAREILVELVLTPAASQPAGVERLRAIGEAWFDYLAGDAFAGGCFLCAASAEMDGRPGPVRDGVEAIMREWLGLLKANVEAAVNAGEMAPSVDPAALAFRLNALGMAANWQRQLFGDDAGIEQARAAWRDELRRALRP